jgi:hypothetical protein
MRMNGIPMDRDDQLEAALDAVSTIQPDYETACIDHAEAESEYRIAKAKAYLNAEGTEKAREATAIVKTENLLRERDRTEAIRDFTRTKLKNAQDAVSARQSLLRADVKTNAAFTG